MDAAHIVGRGKPATRVDLENGVALCRSCHVELDTHPNRKAAFAISILGEDRYRRLVFRSNLTRLSRHEHRFVPREIWDGVWTLYVCEDCGEPGYRMEDA